MRDGSTALGKIKGPHVIFHLFMSFLFAFLSSFIMLLMWSAFMSAPPRTQQSRAHWSSPPFYPSIHPSPPSASPPLPPSLPNFPLQAPATLQDDIILIFTVSLHRMSVTYLQGVDQAADQYQRLNDWSASRSELWLLQSTLLSMQCLELKGAHTCFTSHSRSPTRTYWK